MEVSADDVKGIGVERVVLGPAASLDRKPNSSPSPEIPLFFFQGNFTDAVGITWA